MHLFFARADIVDKTASFVARSGATLEGRIRENEKNNPKFAFMNPSDPYHAYYKHTVKEIQEGRGPSVAGGSAATGGAATAGEAGKDAAAAQAAKPPPKEPLPLEFIAEQPQITQQDLYVTSLSPLPLVLTVTICRS